MSVPIISVGRTKPGSGRQGEKKFYATVKSSGEETLESITRKIEKSSTLSGADIRGVLYALQETMKDELSKGRIVRFGDLGSFRISVGSRPEDSPGKVSTTSVLKTRIIYNPDKEMKAWLRNLRFKKT